MRYSIECEMLHRAVELKALEMMEIERDRALQSKYIAICGIFGTSPLASMHRVAAYFLWSISLILIYRWTSIIDFATTRIHSHS